jgi:RNA polymerase sigma-70 factor (ECF subfamily)
MHDDLSRPSAGHAMAGTFDEVVLPHLGAAHRLARWLLHNDDDADDVVQEASLRALRYFRTFTGGDGRAWFLRIVRNTSTGWRAQTPTGSLDPFDEERHSATRQASDPESLVLQTDDVMLIEQAMKTLPGRFRELLVRRELDGLSYKELGEEMGIPIGTVMSSLSRARRAFRGALAHRLAAPTISPRDPQSRTDSRRTRPDQTDRRSAEYGRTSP